MFLARNLFGRYPRSSNCPQGSTPGHSLGRKNQKYRERQPSEHQISPLRLNLPKYRQAKFQISRAKVIPAPRLQPERCPPGAPPYHGGALDAPDRRHGSSPLRTSHLHFGFHRHVPIHLHADFHSGLRRHFPIHLHLSCEIPIQIHQIFQ